MLRDIAYNTILGLPLVLWVGLSAMALLILAVISVSLTRYTQIRIAIGWHTWLALAGLVMGVIHVILALSPYLGI